MSEYGWTEQFTWWEITLPRAMVYLRLIRRRKTIENGTAGDEPLDDELIVLLEVIEQVKKERNGKRLTIHDRC